MYTHICKIRVRLFARTEHVRLEGFECFSYCNIVPGSVFHEAEEEEKGEPVAKSTSS